MSENNDEWPKAWNEISGAAKASFDESQIGSIGAMGSTEYHFGPLRMTDRTAYINADAGRETKNNRDLWYPLEVYFAEVCND